MKKYKYFLSAYHEYVVEDKIVIETDKMLDKKELWKKVALNMKENKENLYSGLKDIEALEDADIRIYEGDKVCLQCGVSWLDNWELEVEEE